MNQDAAERPNCQKCRGCLIPNRNLLTGRVESVTCAACGETVYRDHARRQPELKESDMARGKGAAHRASHKKRAA